VKRDEDRDQNAVSDKSVCCYFMLQRLNEKQLTEYAFLVNKYHTVLLHLKLISYTHFTCSVRC
jgi:hypothetical protein